jgi:hypothetical protein
MPPAVNTLHIILTLLAYGILVGIGWALALMAIAWPASRIASAAGVICLLILILAWLV